MSKEIAIDKKIIKKSELRARTLYDYNKIKYPDERFLDCTIEEKEETLEFSYCIAGYHPFSDIRSCTRQERLRILLDAVKLMEYRNEYIFSLAPVNLYFDENFRVYIMERDVRLSEQCKEEEFLKEYKALIAFSFQKKYGYDDFLEGGMDLFKKNSFLKRLFPIETVGEVVDVLEENYQKITEDIRQHKLLVNKKMYQTSRIYIVVSALLLVGCILLIGYYYLFDKPIVEAKLQAEIDFLKNDYIQVIDDLSAVTMEQLSYDQKYILSVAFVNMESLTTEQKKNILEKLPINGEEKLMEYWIYIGRLNPLEAENIAMQRSDDELLLYAYMLEKDLVETDTVMTGEEKAAKLDELEGKIEKLAEKYATDEQEE